MKILDNIFASLYTFYRDKKRTIFSTPQDFAIYVMSTGILLWAMFIDFVIVYTNYKSFKINFNIYVALCIAGLFYFLFYLRYIKSSMYLKLYDEYKLRSKANKILWRFLSVMFLMFPFCLGGILSLIWHIQTGQH